MAKFADQLVVQPIDEAVAGQGAASGIALRVQLDSTRTSKSAIGMQIRTAQTADNTGSESVKGAEISARINNDVDSVTAIGIHGDVYLRGTAAKTVTGDVRALQLEIVGDESGATTVTGDVSAIWVRSYFPATAIDGTYQVIKVNTAESGGTAYDAFLKFSAAQAGLVTTQSSATTVTHAIKCLVGGTTAYIPMYQSVG